MGTVTQDLRYGLRQLGGSPVLTVVIVLSVALGVGANTAIFSVIDGLMLKALPIDHPEQLVQLVRHAPTRLGREITFSLPQFERFRAANVLSGLFALTGVRLNATLGGQSELASGQLVSGDYFSTLGVRTVLGRMLRPEDDTPGAPPAAVISHSFWARGFGLDPSLVGRKVLLNRTVFTVVGVTSPEFFGVSPGVSPDLWLPVNVAAQVLPGTSWINHPSAMRFVVLGRLRPGISRDQAQAALIVLYDRMKPELLATTQPEEKMVISQSRLELMPASTGYSGLRYWASMSLLVLMAVAGLVLLITCANIAGLLLARAAARQQEIAVRMALGASRLRLVRQLLTESVLLGLTGGTLGLFLAVWSRSLALRFLPTGPFRTLLELSAGGRVLLFTAAVSLLTGILFGLVPAFRATGLDLMPTLKQSAHSPPRGLRLGGALVVAQIAISLVVLVGANLLVRTLVNLESLDLGFNPEHVLLLTVDPQMAGYQGERLRRYFEELREEIEGVPGVRSASLSRAVPLDGISWPGTAWLEAQGSQPRREISVMRNWVGTSYFKTLGTPLLMGREFTRRDDQHGRRVAIVNQTMARALFGDRNPIGRRIGLVAEPGLSMEIVGLVKDSRYDTVWQEPPALVYTPFLQSEPGAMTFEIQTAGNPNGFASAVRHAVQAIDRDVPVVNAAKLSVEGTLARERLMASLLGFFGLLGLVLASVGLYGLMGYAVARRRREIGIRMALGAGRGDILRSVLLRAWALALCGVAVGIPLALAATCLIEGYLFGVPSYDPVAIATTVALLIAVATVAAYLPGRRAFRLDPLAALRSE